MHRQWPFAIIPAQRLVHCHIRGQWRQKGLRFGWRQWRGTTNDARTIHHLRRRRGTGKSTHAALLADRLKALGIGVVLTREPGGSPGAEAIRHVLLSGAAKPLGAEAEAILFAAARDDHVRATIEPALAGGNWVISDRFIDSTRVYQGVLGHVDPQFIHALERTTIGDLKPDLTFILDVPAKVGLARASKRRGDGEADRFEAESLAFHEELREAYRVIALTESEPLRDDRCHRTQARGRRPDLEDGKRTARSGDRAGRARGRRIVSEADADVEPLHPRETNVLFGHAEAERTLLDAYRGGRIPHAWLIGGPAGIGKATLAYRMARFVLAHPDPGAQAVQSATSLQVDADHPVARRITAQAQADLLVLVRTINEKTGKLRQDIQVDDVRRTVTFFGSTAGEGGWRIAIVDSVDELNREGANALLKVLEEPPRRALLLLVSHSAARVLPTIRSRCRLLPLRPLSAGDVAHAAAAAIGKAAAEADIQAAAAVAEGSVARALALLDGDALALRNRIVALLDRLPAVDPRALHALGDQLYGTDPRTLAAFLDTVNAWLSARLSGGPAEPTRLARVAQAWEKVNRAARDVEEYNLERKPLVFNVFGWLAEAARGA